MIRKEITQKETNAKNKLNRLYNKNLVFPKYRNICAISSFYEYLSSGRVSFLEGVDGAYNLYEREVREESAQHTLNISDFFIIERNNIKIQYYLNIAIYEINKYVNEQNKKILELK